MYVRITHVVAQYYETPVYITITFTFLIRDLPLPAAVLSPFTIEISCSLLAILSYLYSYVILLAKVCFFIC